MNTQKRRVSTCVMTHFAGRHVRGTIQRLQKRPIITQKRPNITQKRPINIQKRPINTQKRHVSTCVMTHFAGRHVRGTIQRLQKSPNITQKRPNITQKRPINIQKRPMNTQKKTCLSTRVSTHFAGGHVRGTI